MIRRLRTTWPDPRPFTRRPGLPVRFLATSDDRDPALEVAANRDALGPLDGILGCGDLEPDWLSFLGDAFRVPLVYVRGNHDHGGAWEEERQDVPTPLAAGRLTELAGITIAGLEWPGVRLPGNERRPDLAWRHVFGIARRAIVGRLSGRRGPLLVISHVPPAGAGDTPTDAYHVGFPAYRWLLDRFRPPLWLHGHTTTASVPRLEEHAGSTTVVNVTGAVLVELWPGPAEVGSSGGRGAPTPPVAPE